MYLPDAAAGAQVIQSYNFLSPVTVRQQFHRFMMMQLPWISIYPPLSIVLLLGAVSPILIALIFGRWKIPPSFPEGVPRAGKGINIFGGLRVHFRGWLSARQSLSEGYAEVNIHSYMLTTRLNCTIV